MIIDFRCPACDRHVKGDTDVVTCLGPPVGTVGIEECQHCHAKIRYYTFQEDLGKEAGFAFASQSEHDRCFFSHDHIRKL